MGHTLKAFISYRRQDAFVYAKPDGSPDFAFIAKLAEALTLAGFEDVFVDTSSIEAAENYDKKIRKNVSESDLFVAIVAGKWVEILRKKRIDGERDDVVREIRIAHATERPIVPLLIDGTSMPRLGDLPVQIRRFYFQNGVSIRSTDSAEAIAATLGRAVSRIKRIRQLLSTWTRAYISFSFFAYFCCAILPHAVGVREFGRDSWIGLATAWSGLYIWPIVFLPFILAALYRPLTTLVESVITAPNPEVRRRYALPLLAGFGLSVLATAMEVAAPFEVPWSIYPSFSGCPNASGAGPPGAAILTHYDRALAAGGVGPLQVGYSSQFWITNKCWPNVFFYLTVPVYQGGINDGYRAERPEVQRTFISLLKSNTTWSKSVWPYVMSFWMLTWIGFTGIVMSIFFVMVQIRRPEDDDVLRLPSEDAYLCLTYSFVGLVAWLPFRMNTIYFKKLYFCEILEKCSIDPLLYLNDVVLGSVLIIAYAFVTTGLLVKYGRFALVFLGTFTIATILAAAFVVNRFGQEIAQFSDHWQSYVGISIPLILIMIALWYFFDPATARDNDDFESDGPRTNVRDDLEDLL